MAFKSISFCKKTRSKNDRRIWNVFYYSVITSTLFISFLSLYDGLIFFTFTSITKQGRFCRFFWYVFFFRFFFHVLLVFVVYL